METPSPEHEPEAYIPDEAGEGECDDELPTDRAAVIEAARWARLEEGGLALDDRTLALFFGLDRNGQELDGAEILAETSDRVIVAITRLEPVGIQTLIGGFRAQHVDLRLTEPIGDRAVIDASTGQRRPSVTELRHGD